VKGQKGDQGEKGDTARQTLAQVKGYIMHVLKNHAVSGLE
jgi:hypothetical protein